MKLVDFSSSRQSQGGVTLIELIAVIVVLGFAASIAVAAMSALGGMGRETQTTEYAQLAQQRLELILNEKRKGQGFTGLGDCEGPDPCCLYSDLHDLDMCNKRLEVTFNPKNGVNNSLRYCQGKGFDYCKVTVNVFENDQDQAQSFTMRLYNYD